MNLSKDRKQELNRVLLDAFRTPEEMKMMVSVVLGENLDRITPSRTSLEHVVFALVEWVEARDRTQEFILGAHRHNPSNHSLKRFYEESVGLWR